LQNGLSRDLSRTPALAGHAPQIVAAVQQGNGSRAFAVIPTDLRFQVAGAIHSSFASTLNDLLIVSGILALVGAVASTALIRSRDFIVSRPDPQTAETVVA
jgi:hypothetical protein